MKSKAMIGPSFEKCLETALKHYHDPTWLGTNSPLAQPYFLGAFTHPSAKIAGRGQALQQAIDTAWEALWGGCLPGDRQTFATQFQEIVLAPKKGGEYAALLLEVRYMQRAMQPTKVSLIWEDELHVSKSQFHRDLRDAIRLLGEELLQLVRPNLRMEQPLPPAAFYGRQNLVGQTLAALKAGQSVALSGMSGVGKTSVAAVVCQQWSGERFFWYTMRPQWGDRLDNLLFALAFFLHQQGASDLWQQILADGGQIRNPEIAQSLARHALARLSPAPLIVVDDADLLRPESLEEASSEYARMVSFLETLSGEAALLLIGQRAILPASLHVEVTGLTLDAIGEWFHVAGFAGKNDDLKDLLDYTGGIPRLLVVCLTLLQSGLTIQDILAQFRSAPGAKPLLDRLWLQLDDAERQVLLQLTVFRSIAPADAWREQQEALENLRRRGLVQSDLAGGVSLLSFWGGLILTELAPEQKEALHQWAAQARAERGEYTAAAYHYWQAGYPEIAIQLWYVHRDDAIASGQAGAAQVIFNSISPQRLPAAEQRALALIRAQLADMNGDYEAGLRSLKLAEWPSPSRASARAHHLRGRFYTDLGDVDSALREYQIGLDELATLARQQIELFTSRTARLRDEGNIAQVWEEIKRAQYILEDTQGTVLDSLGQYVQAKQCYERALELAKEIGDAQHIARTQNNIGTIATIQGDYETALAYLRPALDYFQRAGDAVAIQEVRINMAVALMQIGRYSEALPLAQEAANFFLAKRHRPGIAVTAGNLAEIFMELGQLEEARHWAGLSLAQEQTVNIPQSLYVMGRVEGTEGNYRKAESHLREAIRTAKENQDGIIGAFGWRGLGEVYQRQGKVEMAQDAFREALILFERQGMQNEVNKTQRLLDSRNDETRSAMRIPLRTSDALPFCHPSDQRSAR